MNLALCVRPTRESERDRSRDDDRAPVERSRGEFGEHRGCVVQRSHSGDHRFDQPRRQRVERLLGVRAAGRTDAEQDIWLPTKVRTGISTTAPGR